MKFECGKNTGGGMMGRKYTIQEAVVVLDENTEVVD